MEKIEEQILRLKDELKNTQYYTNVLFRKLDDKNLLFISEIDCLPESDFGVHSPLPILKLCSFLDKYLPYNYYQDVDLEGKMNIHYYTFSYPKLSIILESYNCSTLNKFASFPLENIKITNDLDYSLKFNRDISLNIAILLMKKDIFTVEELYNKFIKVFPKLSNLSLDDFKEIYKHSFPSNGIITRNMLSVLYNLMRIPYIKQNYFKLIIDYSRFRDDEIINYLRHIIIRYLKEIYHKEGLARNISKIDLDNYISTILGQETLTRKLKIMSKQNL